MGTLFLHIFRGYMNESAGEPTDNSWFSGAFIIE